MSNQNSQLKVTTSSKCENGCLDFILGVVIFVQKREHCPSSLCCCKDMGYNKFNLLRNLLLLSLATDASIVRECCWLLEGKATQQIEQQTESRSDNCIRGSISICSLDTHSWQEIQIKPPDVLRWGVWMAGYQTRLVSAWVSNVVLY